MDRFPPSQVGGRGRQPYTTGLLAGAVCVLLIGVTAGVLARPANRAMLGDEPTDMRIDINTADAHRLQLLPGVGPTLAANIIDYRRRHGPFTQQADLQAVHRIGPTIASNIEPWIEMKGSGQH